MILTSSDSAASALLGQEMFEGEEVETKTSQSLCTAYERVWRLWFIKIIIFGHKSPARVSLPFFIKSRCGG